VQSTYEDKEIDVIHRKPSANFGTAGKSQVSQSEHAAVATIHFSYNYCIQLQFQY